MYCFVSGNTITRYEKEDNYRCVETFSTDIKLLQRFEIGESWLTVCVDYEKEEQEDNDDDFFIDRKHPDFYQNNKEQNLTIFPVTRKRIQIENNKIIELKTTVNPNLINSWKSIINL
jgi:hypothetical protein